MKDENAEIAAIVSLIYENVFAPNSWMGLGGERFSSPMEETEAPKSAGLMDPDQLQKVQPYLEHALGLGAQNLENGDAEVSRMALLRELPLPVCIVTKNLRLLNSTSKAKDLLEVGEFLSLDNNRVFSFDKDLQEELQTAVSTAVETGQSGALGLSVGEGHPLSILIAPISNEPGSSTERAAALFFNSEIGDITEVSKTLVDAHGLTQSEADVVAYLVQGFSLDEISQLKNTSVNTVRTQIKSAYAKTGTGRQGELVSLVLNGPAMWLRILKAGTQSLIQPGRVHEVATNTIELRDGRTLGFGDLGPRDGKPVFLIHQNHGLRGEEDEDDELLERLGVRLIVPERPGIGRSSLQEGRSLSDWADDIRELADHLAFNEFHVIGVSGGGPHAAACGAYLGERVRSVGLVASPMPIDDLPSETKIGLLQRFITSMSRHWPSGIQALLEIRVSRMFENPLEAIEDFKVRGSEADKILLDDPRIYRICLRNLEEAQGVPKSVLASELIMLSGPWGFRLSDIKVPVVLWHGKQDQQCSWEHAHHVSQQIPDCEAIIEGEWGHYFYYPEWESILGRLVAPSGFS